MAIKVLRHGNRIAVRNPVNPKQVTHMTNVTFVEEGRRGANHQVSDTTAILDRLIAEDLAPGETTGVDNLRIHTQPVRDDKLHLFPVGREFNAFINRYLYSTPQLRQQQSTDKRTILPRMIDGDPTFFTTTIEDFPVDDQDRRIDRNELIKTHPEYFTQNVVSQTAETWIEGQTTPEQQQTEMDRALAGTGAKSGDAGLAGVDTGGGTDDDNYPLRNLSLDDY